MSLIRFFLPLFAFRLSFGGDGGSSSSSTSTSTTTNTQNIDKRQVVDTGSVGVSSDMSTVNVTATDHDAIAKSFDLAKTSSAATLDSVGKAVTFATDALKLANEGAKNVGTAYQTAQDSAQGLRFVVVGGVIAVAIFALRASGFKLKAA